MEADIRIRNGTVHTPAGAIHADVLIQGEKITGLVARDMDAPARQEIDATGKEIIPGLVDPHAHTRVPGYEQKEDYATSSKAAAVGGITTYVDMPNVEPPTDDVETFLFKQKIARRECYVDFGHFVSGTKLDQIPDLAKAGATGFKIFQVSGGYPHDPRLAMGETEKIYAAFGRIAETGLPCLVHPYNQPLMDLISEQTLKGGAPFDIKTFAEMYTNDIVWSSAVAVLLRLQKATGVRLQVLHTHAGESLKLIKHAKAEGQRVTAAIDLKYYHLTHQDLEEQGARALPGGFITADEERMRIIWESLADGTIDAIDSDHAPHTLEDLELMYKDPWHGPFGSPQYEYMLSVILNDVHQGKMTLSNAIRLLCENPARVIGHFPNKGAIEVGTDADLVVVDLKKKVEPRDEDVFTKCGWTPYHGKTFTGGPIMTILRGQVIAADGKVTGNPGYGRYLAGVPQEPAPIGEYRSPGLAYVPRDQSVQAFVPTPA